MTWAGCAAPPAITCGVNTRLDAATHQCVPDLPPDLNVIVDDFTVGQFRLTEVDVPEQLQVGSPETRTFTITNTGTDDRPVVLVRYAIAPVRESIDELRAAIDEMTDGSELNATFLGMTVIKDLKAGETRQVEYFLSVPNTVQDNLYGFMFALDEVPLKADEAGNYTVDYSQGNVGEGEGTGRLGNAALVYAPATVIVGKPDKPNLRVLYAHSNNASFELDTSEQGAAPMFTVSARMSAQALDVTEPVKASFQLKLPGHAPQTPGKDLGPAWFAAKGLDFASAPATTVWVYDANRAFPLLIQQTQGQVASKSYEVLCRMEYVVLDAGVADENIEPPQVERCAYIFNEEGRDDVYPLHLKPEDIQVLGLTRSLPAQNPGLDANGEVHGEVVYQLTTTQAEYHANVTDNAVALPVVFMAPEPERAAAADDKDDNGVASNDGATGPYPYIIKDTLVSDSFGNDWFGAGYRFEDGTSVSKTLDVVTASYRSAGAAITATLLRADVDLVAIAGHVDWNRAQAVRTWKADASLIVLNYTVLNAAFDPNFCAVTDGIAYCPLFESEPGADPAAESDKTSAGKDKEEDKKGRSVNKEWEWRFMAGPVPLLVKASVGFSMGVVISGKFLVDERTPVTKYGVEFAAGPYAKISASVFGGVSIGVARAGVEGNLTIVQLTFYPKVRPMARLAYDSANGCWKYADASLLFEGPLVFSGPSGDVSIVAYVGFKICIFKCWNFETKVFSFTVAKFATYEKTWKLWSVTKDWGKQAGDPGLCANAYTPPVTTSWRSPTSCNGNYCNASSTGTPANRTPANVLAGYKTTYSLAGTASTCVDVKVSGSTEASNDMVVIYDATNAVQNIVTVGTGASAVRVPGWSGAIEKSVRVCSPTTIVALETNGANTRSGVTVTFTPVQ